MSEGGSPQYSKAKGKKSIRGRGHEREEGWRVRPEREGGDKILGERGRSAQEAGQRDKRSWEFYGAVVEEADRKAIVLKRTRWRLFWGCGCLGWPLFRPFCASGSKALHIAHPSVRRLVDSIQSSLQWLGSVREARGVSTAGYTSHLASNLHPHLLGSCGPWSVGKHGQQGQARTLSSHTRRDVHHHWGA